MSADRKAAVVIGVLYIVGTVAFILSAIVTAGALAGQVSLDEIAAKRDQAVIGAVLVLVAGMALAMVPVVFWPIGRRHDETLAMGYIVFRGAIETTLYLGIATGWLVLLALSEVPGAEAVGAGVATAGFVLSEQLLGIPFALGALLFSVMLYRARLVPRWLSGWGLVGAGLYLVPPVGAMFGLAVGVLMAPLAVQEMVLAARLIAKGFDASGAAVRSADATSGSRVAAAHQVRVI